MTKQVDYVAWVCDQDAYACSGQKCSAQSVLFMHKVKTAKCVPYFANDLGLLLWTVFSADEAYNVLGWLIYDLWSHLLILWCFLVW
jgi:hypothetical protein